jgi:hypothetical protein
MLSSCVLDRHIGMLLSSCCRRVYSTDTSACGRQTHRHATIILLSSCEFDRHIGMRSTDTSVCYYHLVKSTDTSTCCHLVYSTDTSTCCHLVYSTDTSACYYHLAVILCIVPTRRIAGACAVRPQQLLCGHIVDFFNFMLPKRRFWKVALTFTFLSKCSKWRLSKKRGLVADG